MIQVENVSILYGSHALFTGASFTIHPGERCGLVGSNGSGKTTLFRLLVGEEKPDSGTISFSKGYRLGYLDQHIRFSAPTVLEEAVLGLPVDERENVYLAEKLLFGLGFQEKDLDLAPELLSGGYHLRLHLTKVLLSQPDCLLLDEPTNYLDILSLRFLARFLKKWKGELILISHDREFMDSITTHTLGIHRNKVRKIRGGTIEFFTQIVQEEEIYEKTRAHSEKKRAHMQAYVERFGAKASKAAQAQSRQKMIDRIPVLEELKSLHELDFHFQESPFHGKKMLDAKNLCFGYDEEFLIHDLSLAIEKGEKLAIIGKNGYGKSTLMRILARELAPQRGGITYSDQALIGYFGQTHIQRLEGNKTIEEEIASANPQLGFSNVKRICGQMLFSGDASRKKISILSGGEKSRVLLGKILAKPCNLLLLDEPTHHLDIESVEALIDALEEFTGAIVVVTHSELMLRRLVLDKLIVCHQRRQNLFLGGYEEFLEKIGWEEERESSGAAKPAPRKDERKEKPAKPSKETKPLRQERERLEKEIQALEEQQAREHHLLIQASEKREAQTIQALQKSTGAREREIEMLYDKLSELEKMMK